MKEKNLSGNLSRLRSELERRLIVMRYSKGSANAYMRIFGWVEDYIKEYGETNYTKELGQLVEYPLQSQRTVHSGESWKVQRQGDDRTFWGKPGSILQMA